MHSEFEFEKADDQTASGTLTETQRRDALKSIGKFAALTGPGIIALLASEQAVASGGDDPECGKEPVC